MRIHTVPAVVGSPQPAMAITMLSTAQIALAATIAYTGPRGISRREPTIHTSAANASRNAPVARSRASLRPSSSPSGPAAAR
jgi:hypothetical protein